ncbi:hypothetical protein PRUB_a3305 [Pseudoalteromonas rubra]|uniref:Uncharacterized protein n=1 Tax=Pseudoalteromonas rubra TaxID=43658 RepID=A0A8T0C2E0_9GAMM|nr:hypothetical protein PRUB_a3305 [Pseudoalteromonas rubra]
MVKYLKMFNIQIPLAHHSVLVRMLIHACFQGLYSPPKNYSQ